MAAMEAIHQIQSIAPQPKDMTALFNQLQVNVSQSQSRLSDGTASTLSVRSSSSTQFALPTKQQNLELQPSSSSETTTNNNNTLPPPSLPLQQQHPPITTCPCHHWLVSEDSEHCGQCDAPHSTMVIWQAERRERMKRIRAYKRQWWDLTATKDQQQNDMMSLQRTILEHRESLMTCEEDMTSLQQDIEMLRSKCKDESAQVEAIERAKQAAKREIEDLGQYLFKEVQDMVGIEQQEKAILQTSCDSLKQQLEQTQLDLDKTIVQLQALRMDIGRWGDHQDEQQHNMLTSPTTFNNSNNNNDSIIIDGNENDPNDIVENTESGRSSTATAISSSSSSISTPASSSSLSSSSSQSSSGPLMMATSQKFLIRAKMDLAALQNGGHVGNLQLETFEDDQQLLDFQEFIDSATSTSFSLRKLHGLPFIKMCLADDIEPCLRFGPHPKMTNGKRILEAIQIKTCFVEKCPPGFVHEQAALLAKDRLAKKNKPSLWDKLAASATTIAITTTTTNTTNTTITTTTKLSDDAASIKSNTITTPSTSSSISVVQDQHQVSLSCATCGRQVMDASTTEKDLTYRFRMSYFDEWACIDRYCADRLTSVISFYTFLRQLRIGDFKGRSLMDIYQECSRLRLSMFLSRLGAFPPSITST